MNITKKLRYYFWASYRRKLLDQLQEKHRSIYRGIVLDIGGRDRGKFKKPKNKVEKWIFADIEKNFNPDIVLDVSNMPQVETGSIDVVSSMELFVHTENMELGINECFRVLKNGGYMVMSVPLLCQIQKDPVDYQRWTEEKWRKELKKIGFKIENFEITGRFFSILGDMLKNLIKSLPILFKYPLFLFFPLIDIMVLFDKTDFAKNNNRINKFHGGYFIIVKK